MLQDLEELEDLEASDYGVGSGDGGDYVTCYALGGVEAGGFDGEDAGAEVGRGGYEAHGEVVVLVELGGGSEEGGGGGGSGVDFFDDGEEFVAALWFELLVVVGVRWCGVRV